ncbi:uncharacterized protein TRIADDRAFT_27647 [Trichoplax adhaerens]|uniref:Transmembrane 9 superfamily member n=1 Tax=Trichoplax adhaerens TaxID=10228 RepID=B3S1C0_TRIAD|nr:hypothetical protein TRIADDRAFT_27647 [Trichoplax adhaerens]EDV23217.1 hypothetical protein TRIADDRAFT_27647 [Trichoplax adhaerens]|eukprot:XP_002114127.1 hypothetical protein TRIADDRAFT_27647 [Trichoplax adhaerens]
MALGLIYFFTLNVQFSDGFYLPGVAPHEYQDRDKVIIKAVKMTSIKTAHLPYDYYYLPFCPPEGKKEYKPENLGEVLRGDRIVNTAYKLNMNKDKPCEILCGSADKPITISKDDGKKFIKLIKQSYSVHMIVDNLPVATKLVTQDNRIQYEHGFKLGVMSNNVAYLYNHIQFNIKVHQNKEKKTFRIVGFEAAPRSYALDQIKSGKGCKLPQKGTSVPGQAVKADGTTKLMYTYSVTWEEEESIEWASRWDTYLRMSDVQIHWFSIVNSLVIVLVLSGALAMILIRTLRRDIANYNKDDVEETMEETGWKLVHGDVFRPPPHPRLLASCVGAGVQIFYMFLVTIIFAMFGMLSPARRGALMNAGIVMFVLMGTIAGYSSGRLFKTIKGQEWKKSAFLTATLYPGIIFGTCFILNFFLWGQQSTGAVPFTTMLALLLLWFGISTPLVYLGSYFGYRKQPYEHPVRTNQIPRQVPEQVWYMHPIICTLIAGVLPFGAFFIELFFILTAIWENQFYYLFGFLFLVFLILVVSCSEITIALTYFQLCAENYHWWWRSFFMSGGCSIYVFAYCIFYYVAKLDIIDFVPTLLYFGYTMLMILTFYLLTGTIGFFSTYWFIRRIYGAVKID